MVLLLLGLISIFLCYKWGDWRNWRTYYPTILFYIIADFNHALLTTQKELWLINGFGNDTLADYFVSFVIAPGIIILYLSNYPKKFVNRVFYVLSYVAVLSLIEYVANKLHGITYYNEWNLMWTIIVYTAAFILIKLHQKHPLAAWLIFILLTGFVIIHFKISILNLS